MSVNIPYSLIERIQAARKITVLTGAGISKESGVPTFREAQTGLWSQYDPQALATPIAFLKDPALVWNWYAWRRELVSQAKPNPGHLALVDGVGTGRSPAKHPVDCRPPPQLATGHGLARFCAGPGGAGAGPDGRRRRPARAAG
ncbi:MAG: hypothetical protein KDE34_16550 [Anaerolineales bacterium]|nr:hypothetical protein [Anaerolineales bacterium]